VNQPIAAAVTSANSCLHWLAGEVPNLDKGRAASKGSSKTEHARPKSSAGFASSSRKVLCSQVVDVNEVIEEMIVLLAVRQRDTPSPSARSWRRIFPGHRGSRPIAAGHDELNGKRH
jgi:hypothetical protein